MSQRAAGYGIATLINGGEKDGTVLDTWFPTPVLGDLPANAPAELASFATPDNARGVRSEVVGIEIEFKGTGVEEVGFVKNCLGDYKLDIGREIIEVDPKLFRPTEADFLVGSPEKAKEKLNWKPKHHLKSIVKEMMESDLKDARLEQAHQS
jgi:hypothetical protein